VIEANMEGFCRVFFAKILKEELGVLPLVEFEALVEFELFDFKALVELDEFWKVIKSIKETSTVFSQYWVIAITLRGPYLVSNTILYLMPCTIW